MNKSQMIHVWYIYLHLDHSWGKCIAKYTIHGSSGSGFEHPVIRKMAGEIGILLKIASNLLADFPDNGPSILPWIWLLPGVHFPLGSIWVHAGSVVYVAPAVDHSTKLAPRIVHGFVLV